MKIGRRRLLNSETYEGSRTGIESDEASGGGNERFWQRVRKRMHSPTIKTAKDDLP